MLRRLAILCAVLLLHTACGRCGGAVRDMGLGFGEGAEIPPDRHFRIRGDGPGQDDEALRAASGIDVDTWELLDPADERVPAEVRGDSGGHMCLNGVGFDLVPVEPLASGEHTLVLWLERIAWPLVGREIEPVTRAGERALVRSWLVVAE